MRVFASSSFAPFAKTVVLSALIGILLPQGAWAQSRGEDPSTHLLRPQTIENEKDQKKKDEESWGSLLPGSVFSTTSLYLLGYSGLSSGVFWTYEYLFKGDPNRREYARQNEELDRVIRQTLHDRLDAAGEFREVDVAFRNDSTARERARAALVNDYYVLLLDAWEGAGRRSSSAPGRFSEWEHLLIGEMSHQDREGFEGRRRQMEERREACAKYHRSYRRWITGAFAVGSVSLAAAYGYASWRGRSIVGARNEETAKTLHPELEKIQEAKKIEDLSQFKLETIRPFTPKVHDVHTKFTAQFISQLKEGYSGYKVSSTLKLRNKQWEQHVSEIEAYSKFAQENKMDMQTRYEEALIETIAQNNPLQKDIPKRFTELMQMPPTSSQRRDFEESLAYHVVRRSMNHIPFNANGDTSSIQLFRTEEQYRQMFSDDLRRRFRQAVSDALSEYVSQRPPG